MDSSVERLEVGLETWDRVSFPNGSRMIYVEVPGFESARNHHTYWRAHPDWKRGKQLAGASSMVSTFDLRTDNLTSWVGREAATTGNADPSKFYRDRGTRIHAVGEALATGESFPDVSEMPESDKGYVRALMRWWSDREPDVVAVEQFVLHGDMGYAGRLDLRADIGGLRTVVDYKTSKNLYPKHGAQLVAYDLASEWCGLGKADELLILQLCENGEFFEVPAFVTEDEFLSAMDTRRVAGRVAKAQRDWIKAAA